MPITCPNTTWRSVGRPSQSSRETVFTHRHSSAQGEAATRGGRTRREGAGARPALAISLTPRAKGAEVWLTCSRRSQVVKLQTNSFVSSMKASESLRVSLENITIGGRLDTPLNHE